MNNNKARLLALFAALGSPLLAQYGGFGGPSILSRGMEGGGRTGANPVGFRVYAGVRGTYWTNLNSFDDQAGAAALRYRNSLGTFVMGGAQGYRTTPRTSTSLDLGVNYLWMQNRNVAQGLSQSISLTHSRQFTRRVTWYLGVQAQSTNRGIAFANARYSPEPLPELSPQQEEIFDTRTYRTNLGTGVTFQKSARLSFSAQVGAFDNNRKSPRLIDSRGILGSASMQYSLTRRQYVGAAFSYGTFFFPGSYGETKYYTPQGFYGVTLSRAWNFNLFAGIYNSRTDRLVRVQLDPFIAELTGQQSVLEAYRGNNTGFSGGASLVGSWRAWGVTIRGMRGIMPGNSLYLTSEQTTVSASVNHNLGRQASWMLQGRVSKLRPLTQGLPDARFYSMGTSFNYRLNHYLTLNSNVNVFRTQAIGSRVETTRFIAAAGIFFSPGELPLHIF